MPISPIAIPRYNYSGAGGVGGGGGNRPQGSMLASSVGISGQGMPVLNTGTGFKTKFRVSLTQEVGGGDKADLTNCTAKFLAKEAESSEIPYIVKDCDVFPETSEVEVQLLPADLYMAGIFQAGFLIYDPDGDKNADYRCLLSVLKGPDHPYSGNSPITAMDIRMALLDTSPEANTLLGDLEFSDFEIYTAMTRAVDTWNETPPLIRNHTVANFPYREAMRWGASGYLLESAAARYMRNELNYNAAGLAVNDQSKANAYLTLAAKIQARFKEFVLTTKYNINAQSCYGIIGSRAFQGWGYW